MGAQQVTAKVIQNVKSFSIDFGRQILLITDTSDNRLEFDISANNTSTLTYSAGNYTLTIS